MPESSPPPLPGSNPRKSGLTPIAWVAIGCGGMLLVAFTIGTIAFAFVGRKVADYARQIEENPAKAAAELFVRVNPELEIVKVDDEAGTLTIRMKETGKEVTLTYADIAEGKFSVMSEDRELRVEGDPGNGDLAKVTIKHSDRSLSYFAGNEANAKIPVWVSEAAYPGAPPPTAVFAADAPEERSGSLETISSDNLAQVAQFYRNFLQHRGYDIDENSPSAEAGEMISFSARKEAEGRTLVIVTTKSQEGTQIFVTFKESIVRKEP
ncbi:MAG TPA: hypothetical protein VIS99_14250 [Terrimicrobiaceae bacterium]